MTRCPVCSSLFQTVIVGPRTWGTCKDCGARWVRDHGTVHVVSEPEVPVDPRGDARGTRGGADLVTDAGAA